MPLTIPELKTAASFLQQAKALIESVRDLFRSHDGIVAVRMNDIATRIEDEREFVERLIVKEGGSTS